MCYTNKLFQFKVSGPAWEVINAGQSEQSATVMAELRNEGGNMLFPV